MLIEPHYIDQNSSFLEQSKLASQGLIVAIGSQGVCLGWKLANMRGLTSSLCMLLYLDVDFGTVLSQLYNMFDYRMMSILIFFYFFPIWWSTHNSLSPYNFFLLFLSFYLSWWFNEMNTPAQRAISSQRLYVVVASKFHVWIFMTQMFTISIWLGCCSTHEGNTE